MKIDFNNVRKKAIYAYEALAIKLNEAIIKNRDSKEYAKPNGHRSTVDLDGYVLIDANDIQENMDNLRSLIGAIGFTYKEGDEDFKDIFEEIYPENEGKSMISFNEVEE